MRKKLIAFNYFGGKYTWLENLYEFFPDHTHFIDLFCGSMVVTLNKKPSKLDTANDADGKVVNFFKVLREQPQELIRQLELTPVARGEYTSAWPIDQEDISELEMARRFFVRCRMAFQGSGLVKHTGFNACVATSERGVSKNVAKYLSAVSKLNAVVERLKNIQIENLDYKAAIYKYDREDTFMYVDPPYELRMRNYKKWYSKEFESDEDHMKLAADLNAVKGKVMISGYDSLMYQKLYKGWYFMKLPARGNSLKNGKQTEECIWMNYNPMTECKKQISIDFKTTHK